MPSNPPTFAEPRLFPRLIDDEETIYAVQRKAFLVHRKLELTPVVAASFTDRFVESWGVGASVAYHLAENFGLEAFGGYHFPRASGLTREILETSNLQPELAKLTQMLWSTGFGVQWSPVYGKVQVLGKWLGNFNFYVSAGAALGMTRVRCTPSRPLDPHRGFEPAICPDAPPERPDGTIDEVFEPTTLRLMGVLAGGARFYFSNRIGLKLEVRDYLFPARVYRPPPGPDQVSEQTFTDAIRNNIFVQVGLSFLLGGEED